MYSQLVSHNRRFLGSPVNYLGDLRFKNTMEYLLNSFKFRRLDSFVLYYDISTSYSFAMVKNC